MIDETEIRISYQQVYDATVSLELATRLELERRAELESKKAELLALGLIDGKNAETREGQLRERLASEYAELATTQAAVASLRTDLTLAQLAVDRCKTLLKLYALPERAELLNPYQ